MDFIRPNITALNRGATGWVALTLTVICVRSSGVGVELYAQSIAYPGTGDWNALSEGLGSLIEALTNYPGFKARLETKVIATVGDSWEATIRSTPKKYEPLSSLRLSAGVRIGAPYHQNEHINFWDSIREGCANMSKHIANAPEGVARALLIRLSKSAPVVLYTKWLHGYFDQYPEEPIEFIFLYQADVAVDVDKRKIHLTHYVEMVETPSGRRWSQAAGRAAHCVHTLVGRWIEDPLELARWDPETNDMIAAEELHWYQKVDIYRWYPKQVEPIHVSSLGSGVNIYAVIGGGPELQLASFLAPPQYELVLLP